jgi:hypothetical protein
VPTVYPIEWVPPVVTGRYRNMQRRDVAVWERWLRQHGPEWEMVAYDVAVGGVVPDLPDLSDAEIAGWKYTTSQKIDVLLRTGDDITVVEVKPVASLTAIGGAIGYPLALAREEPTWTIVQGAIICEHLPLDIEWLTKALGIRTWVV